MYISRHLEVTLKNLSGSFGAVLVTGPRQVGKTTLLKHCFPEAHYLSFDDKIITRIAQLDPHSFLDAYPTPLIIDEIQYVPELLPEIKIRLDTLKQQDMKKGQHEDNKAGTSPDQDGQPESKGRFLLTGSQQFQLMQGVAESLAGRLAIQTLLGLSAREAHKDPFNQAFLPTASYLKHRNPVWSLKNEPLTVWEMILRGSFPELIANRDIPSSQFYGSYINTYLERDVRSLSQVGDLRHFNAFMVVLASRTGQLLNMSDIASQLGISMPTVKRWISVLEASQIIYLLRPFYSNISKRALKTPKLYFLDTGLAAHLTGWTTPDVLRLGAMSGAFFETFVVAEVLKSYYNAGIIDPPLYYYRDQQKNEIDLIIVKDGMLHPIEIKASASPHSHDIKAFEKLVQFENSGLRVGEGCLLCLYPELAALSKQNMIVPLSHL